MDAFNFLLENSYDFLFYTLSFILVISIVVFIHELGHYFVAKLCGVKIESFSIGFGPEIFGLNDKSGTRWKVSCIPLGGYVKMFGDSNVASVPDPSQPDMTHEEKSMSFQAKELYQKSLIVLAGPLANILLAILILAFLFTFKGKYQPFPIVGDVVKDGAAYNAGLMTGDIILSMDGSDILLFKDIKKNLEKNKKNDISITYKRGDSVLQGMITPKYIEQSRFGFTKEVPMIGIIADGAGKPVKSSPHVAIVESTEETFFIVNLTLRSIGQMLVGKRSTDEIGGPISIARYSAQSLKNGVVSLSWFIAMISINLGVVNLLPVPMLDGGHLFYYVIEGIFRRRVGSKFQGYAAVVGTILLLSLTIFAVFNDVKHIIE